MAAAQIDPIPHGDFWLCARCGKAHDYMVQAAECCNTDIKEVSDMIFQIDCELATTARFPKGKEAKE